MSRVAPVLLFLLLAPVTSAQTVPKPAPTTTIDQLIEHLDALRVKRSDLERQERDILEGLRQKLREQMQRLQALGVQVDGVPPPLPPVVPAPLPVPADTLLAAYTSDRNLGHGGPAELRAIAAQLRAAGEALERARPAQVSHLRGALEVIIGGKLAGKLPSTFLAVKANIASGFPADGTAMTPEVGVAVKLILLSLAGRLEKLTNL
mgnify:CR=1 FL=1